jgi:hypothetical protein
MISADEIAQEIARSPQSLVSKLSWHFANFEDGGIPDSLIPVAVQAIELANAGGDLSTMLELPDGIYFRNGSYASAQDVIEGHHLHFFISPAE